MRWLYTEVQLIDREQEKAEACLHLSGLQSGVSMQLSSVELRNCSTTSLSLILDVFTYAA